MMRDNLISPAADEPCRIERVGPWLLTLGKRSGLRHVNLGLPCEDHVAYAPVSLRGFIQVAVADGVGSGARGDVCSQAAATHAVQTGVCPIEGLSGEAGRNRLVSCIESAQTVVQEALHKYSDQPGASMLVTAWLDDCGRGHLAHVGDARAYLCSADDATCLTQDHSYRNTGEVAPPGGHPDDPARMIGVFTGPPDIQSIALQSGQALLLCSDGLYGYLAEPTFLSMLVEQMRQFNREPSDQQAMDFANQLLESTLCAGSDDDIAFALLIYQPIGIQREPERLGGDTRELENQFCRPASSTLMENV